MNIDELQAGLELDKLVAEKVMGWHLKTGSDGLTFWADAERDEYIEAYDYHEHSGSHYDPWSPSTDMNDAWMAVDRMINMPYGYECYLSHQFDGWECYFARPDKEGGVAHNKPEAVAICIAALKAVETD